jgi:predicted homoserine dehydrogenase-like protein
MNLSAKLQQRAEAGKPVRVGLIGAGKFGTTFLSQALRTPGLHILGVADLSLDRARAALARAGWTPEQMAAHSFASALAKGSTHITGDAADLIAANGLDVVVDATGDAPAGIDHVRLCAKHGRHVVMVNVEADALAGPLLARWAQEANIVYSLAYGDQPALIAELVD